jgi:hypothetical protein
MWLNNSKLRIFFDMHLPAWPEKGVAEAFDPSAIAGAFVDSGADSVILYAKCQYGNFYTSLPHEKLHPGLAGRDLLAEISGHLRKEGIKTIAYYSVSWDEKICDEHPEWMAVNAQGEKGKGPYRWRTLCINSPYADLVESHIVALAATGAVDGLWIDMTFVGDGNCYCERCRQSFKAQFGFAMPFSVTDQGYQEFLDFRYDLVEAFYTRLRKAAKEVAPHLALTNNYWGYPYSSTGMGSRAIGAARQGDFVTGEAYTDWTGIRATSFLPIFLRGVAEGRPFETLIGRFINTWDYSKKPLAFLFYEAFSVFAHGSTVTLDDQPYFDGRIDSDLYRQDLAQVFGELKKHRNAVVGNHLRHVGIFHSQKTKDSTKEQKFFIRDIAGSFRLIRDLHWQTDFVFDENLSMEQLHGLKALVLSNTKELSLPEWMILEDFLGSGGLVVASGQFCNSEVLHRLEKLGLSSGSASEFSVSYLRWPGCPRDLLVRGTYFPYALANQGIGGVVEPICETTSERFFHNNLPSPHTLSRFSGLTELTIGKGKLAVFSQPIFQHYAKEPSRELREIVGNLISNFCTKPLFTLQIPMKMDYSIVQNDETFYIHLLNPNAEPSLCCGLMETMEGNFERSFEYMEEVVPVHELGITINSNRRVKTRALREGARVSQKRAREMTRLTVSQVNLWEIIEVSFSKGRI